ncbi:MAG: hypothetical protein ABIM98_06430 [candidate division WOR-3 bacterium]
MSFNLKGFILRKLLHLISVLFPVAILIFDKKIYLPIIAFFLGGFLTADYLRFEIKSFKIFFKSFFGEMIKKEEQNFFTGATWVCISAFLLTLFFPKKVAVISLLFLSISDNFASIVGKLFGKTKLFKNKTLEGFLAFLIVSFIITLFFQELSVKKKIIISLFASFAELFSGNIDDNFTVPLLTAILLYNVL